MAAAELVHPVAPEDIPEWVRAMATAFLQASEGEDVDRWVRRTRQSWVPARAYGMRDRGRFVGTLRTESRTITVPGHDGGTEVLAADALTNVTVAATHRRRGYLTRMLDGSLREARERGDAISILIAAEWPIYGRFGYAPAVSHADFTLYPRRPGGRIPGDLTGVRQVEREEFGQLAPAVFAAARRRRAGQVDRDRAWWARTLGLDGIAPSPQDPPDNWLVHEGADGPDGLLAWKATRDFGFMPPLGAVTVSGLFAASGEAERVLSAYLTGLDVVEEVVLPNRPPDEPIRWRLPDARTLVLTQLSDFLWLRLLDVPTALSARRYAVADEIVLEVLDNTAASVAGRYRLHADGTDVTCEPTAATPALTVTQSALASAYLGGGPLRARVVTGEVTEHVTGALQRADAMFLTALAPWNATSF
jgi:predicted acetyltransferase